MDYKGFERKRNKSGIHLPGFIDIVFLLLIFALVAYAVSTATTRTSAKDESGHGKKFDLPRVERHVGPEMELHTLCLQIEPLLPGMSDQRQTGYNKMFVIFWPDEENGSFAAAESDTFYYSNRPPKAGGRFRFDTTTVYPVMKDYIRRFKDEYFREPHPANSIQIRAEQETQFQVINSIMTYLQTFNDTIPRVTVRTLAQIK